MTKLRYETPPGGSVLSESLRHTKKKRPANQRAFSRKVNEGSVPQHPFFT